MAKETIPYFVWRDGRPRWVPGPKLRALGFKGRDLKDGAGEWLTRREARGLAGELNEQVAKALQGVGTPLAAVPARLEHSTAGLVKAFLDRRKIRLDDAAAAPGEAARTGREGAQSLEGASGAGRKLARSSRLAYRAHGNLLRDWMGDAPAASITPAMVEEFYEDRIEDMGATSANAIMRSWKTIFYYGEEKLRWSGLKNPVVGLELAEASGRLVLWSNAELACIVAVADYLGWHSLGDAVTRSLLTSQRRKDVLTVQVIGLDDDGICRFTQSKTGREAKVKAVPMLVARERDMRARNAGRFGDGTQIICEATGKPYPADGAYFGKRFRAAKLIATGGNGDQGAMDDALSLLGVTAARVASMPIARVPSLKGKWFRDLRDTAITWLAAAGCNRYEISIVSGLSLKSVDAILDKHYLVRDDGFAISAGDKLAAYLGKSA